MRSPRGLVARSALALIALSALACIGSEDLTNTATSCDGGNCVDGASSGPGDAGAGTETGGDATVCAPGSVANFVPQWKPPKPAPGTCTQTQVGQFVACLFSAAQNDKSCRDYITRADNAACASCILTDVDAPKYGPLVRLGPDAITVNVEGCVALVTSDVTPSGCGAKAQALAQCRAAACVPNCPVTDQKSLNTYLDCEEAAGKSVCESYLTASACIQTLLQGPAGACASGTTPLEAATAVVRYFCGQ